MRILMVGDIMGKPGRRAIRELVPSLRQELGLDLVIANAENTAGGRGLTLETAHELLDSGVDVLTSGNHIWDQRDIFPHLDGHLPILRPLNYPRGTPGRGYWMGERALVISLIGRVFIGNFDCPFRAMDTLLEALTDRPRVTLVDFHAEATSEKVALGWYLDGRVSALVGTHTHVPTADLRILPKATAYVSDVGMTGPVNSVIGSEIGAVLQRFLTQVPVALPVAASGPIILNSVMVEVDEDTGSAKSIVRVDRYLE